jgi:hypothetical protein
MAVKQIGIVLERQVLRDYRCAEQAVTGVQRGTDRPDQRIDNDKRYQHDNQPGERQADPLFAFNTG